MFCFIVSKQNNTEHVVVIRQDGIDTAYYVDSYGFKQIPEFFANNPLEKVEELLEDDYGMIDGINPEEIVIPKKDRRSFDLCL